MDKYEFKATNLIAEAFEENKIKFRVEQVPDIESIVVGFPIEGGPSVEERFISTDNNNDVSIRIFCLIAKTPEQKRSRVKDVCNILNHKVRHLKFDIDEDGDVRVEYDFPQHIPDSAVGEIAVEMFARTMRTLDRSYGMFMKALYTDDAIEA